MLHVGRTCQAIRYYGRRAGWRVESQDQTGDAEERSYRGVLEYQVIKIAGASCTLDALVPDEEKNNYEGPKSSPPKRNSLRMQA
jgi:hypothetical protein